ncbi:MAG: hypothetical protein ABSE16_11375 [Verrucomicrobiota bacterium]|jgi:hypothetical protein
MKEIELYVHSAKDAEPMMIRVGAGASVEELLKKVHEAGFCEGPLEELYLFAEEDGNPCNREHSLEYCGLKHRHHIHCHRCRQVRIGVNYNGVEKDETFPPSAKVKRVLRWAVDAFGLKGADAEDKVLRLAEPPQIELLGDQHIGSFVHSLKCELTLCLVPRVRFQG